MTADERAVFGLEVQVRTAPTRDWKPGCNWSAPDERWSAPDERYVLITARGRPVSTTPDPAFPSGLVSCGSEPAPNVPVETRSVRSLFNRIVDRATRRLARPPRRKPKPKPKPKPRKK